MDVARVERVTLGRMLASGLSREEIALLIMLSERDYASRDLLAEAAGAPIHVEPTPEGDGVVYATVEIGAGLGWRLGTVYDPAQTLPATIATAAVGRRIGEILRHTDIDPELRVGRTDDPQGVFAVPFETVSLSTRIPPAARWRVAAETSRRRRADAGVQRRTLRMLALAATICVVTTSTSLVIMAHLASWTFGSLVRSASAVVVMLVVSAMAVDAWSGQAATRRILGKGRADATPAKAHMRMLDRRNHIWARRGFDDEGNPR